MIRFHETYLSFLLALVIEIVFNSTCMVCIVPVQVKNYNCPFLFVFICFFIKNETCELYRIISRALFARSIVTVLWEQYFRFNS